MAARATHDCHSAIVRRDGDEIVLLSAYSGKPFASIDRDGLHIFKNRGKGKEDNVVSLKALEVLIRELKKA
jgi:hypothetical protein